MTHEDMSSCIDFLEVFDPCAAYRVRMAGLQAAAWAAAHDTMTAPIARAAALAACELQCIVEAHRAERAGGIFIKGA